MEFDWSPTKNAELKERHGFGFERILVALAEGALLDEREHPNNERYAHQRQFIVLIDDYVWVVPFVLDGERTFLKTLFPSRQATREYLGGRDGQEQA
jgi:uncharacterized DUF497 family protein